MVERRAQLRLAHEALLDVAGAVGVQALDGDLAVEPLVVAEQDRRHAAGAEPPQDPIAPAKQGSLRMNRHLPVVPARAAGNRARGLRSAALRTAGPDGPVREVRGVDVYVVRAGFCGSPSQSALSHTFAELDRLSASALPRSDARELWMCAGFAMFSRGDRSLVEGGANERALRSPCLVASARLYSLSTAKSVGAPPPTALRTDHARESGCAAARAALRACSWTMLRRRLQVTGATRDGAAVHQVPASSQPPGQRGAGAQAL